MAADSPTPKKSISNTPKDSAQTNDNADQTTTHWVKTMLTEDPEKRKNDGPLSRPERGSLLRRLIAPSSLNRRLSFHEASTTSATSEVEETLADYLGTS